MSRKLASLKRPAAAIVGGAIALSVSASGVALAEPEASAAPDTAKQSTARSAPKPATQASKPHAAAQSTTRSAVKPAPQMAANDAVKQSLTRSTGAQAPQMAANDAAKQSLTRSAEPVAKAAKPDAATQSPVRTAPDPAAKSANPDARPAQALAMRTPPPDSPKQAAQAPLERKAVKMTRSSKSWYDWLFGQ